MNEHLQVVNPPPNIAQKSGRTCSQVVSFDETNTRNCSQKFSWSESAGTSAPSGFEAGPKGAHGTHPTPSQNFALLTLGERIEELRSLGFTSAKIRKHLRQEFGNAYISTLKAWRDKKKNAKREFIHVDSSFRDFLLFLSVCGFRLHHSYQLDRINPELCYAIGNVRWVPPSDNARNRGNAARIIRYMSITGKSRSQAYRDLNSDRETFMRVTAEGEAAGPVLRTLETKEWHETCLFLEKWEKTFFELYEVPAKQPRSASMMRRVITHLRDYPEATDNLEEMFYRWDRIQKEAVVSYGIHLGERPSVNKLFKHPAEVYALLCEQTQIATNNVRFYSLFAFAIVGLETPLTLEEKASYLCPGLDTPECIARIEALYGEITHFNRDLRTVFEEQGMDTTIFEDEYRPVHFIERFCRGDYCVEDVLNHRDEIFAKAEEDAPAWRANYGRWLCHILGPTIGAHVFDDVMHTVTPTSPPSRGVTLSAKCLQIQSIATHPFPQIAGEKSSRTR